MTKSNELTLEKLKELLEKYVETAKNKVDKIDEEQQKQELEAKIEQAQLYLDKIKAPENRNFIKIGRPKKYWNSTEGWKEPLCERYGFRYEDNKGNEKSVTLDISQEISKKLELSVEEEFYVAEELLNQKEIEGGITLENEGDIFLQRHLIQEETNKGKIAGTAGGVGAGALGGAALGAGAMAALAPWTFGFSLTLAPTAAGIGAIFGALGGGTTGLAIGSITDKLSNSEKAETKRVVKSFLEDYKTMCQDTNEIRELEAYIENSNNWK